MPLDTPSHRLEANGSALADEVYDLLARAILAGELAPGERIRDVEIANQLGISRTPVREAIQRLVRQRLIEVARHRYTRVAALGPEITRETIELIGLFAGDGLRVGLERMSDADLAAGLADIDLIVEASERGDLMAVRRLSGVFYRRVTMATANRLYITVLKELATPVQHFLGDWVPFRDDPAARAASFRRLQAAVAARDGRTAEIIVREQHGLT